MTKDFIIEHRNDDIRQLALQAQRYPDIDMPFAIQQIDGWQRARYKLPMWANHDGIIYPPHISMEQCSSEQTALYKQHLAKRLITTVPEVSTSVLYDLTGGFGVDFSYMSQVFDNATYIEQQQHLCDIARHNFITLNLVNTVIVCDNSTKVLSSLPDRSDNTTTVIYLDPARRDTNGKKTYAISDCTPDVITLLPTLKQKADIIIIKLSPMLDHHEALRLLPGITEVHIISVNNECKEILLVINQKEQHSTIEKSTYSSVTPTLLYCVNNNDIFITPIINNSTTPTNTNTPNPVIKQSIAPNDTLYIPNASIMKAGCFSALCQQFHLQAIDNNSHLFISSQNDKTHPEKVPLQSFPGRTFTIISISSLNKKELKKSLASITQANIAVRNFPLSADALRKKLSLKDGGDIYIFATTISKKHILLICKK